MSNLTPSRFVPPTRLLVTGRQETRRTLFAKRPQGVGEWILIYNEGGRSYYKSSGPEFIGKRGDIILIRPEAPHEYGMQRPGYWKNVWTHFLPRPDCLDWLKWPEFAPGMMHLHLREPVREQIRARLYEMDAIAHSTRRRRDEFAVNALEHALLLCDSQNPRHAEAAQDARIARAVHQLCLHPGEPFTLKGLAHFCGLSRSRFAELFHKQMGVPPLTFLENQRLRRAKELLEHTALTISEISEQSGFASPFYFSLRFKKHFGLSPRHYRHKK